MNQYKNDEELKLNKRFAVTEEVFNLVNKARKALKKIKGVEISRSKLVCNALIKELNKYN